MYIDKFRKKANCQQLKSKKICKRKTKKQRNMRFTELKNET